jgi:hypothetical protein
VAGLCPAQDEILDTLRIAHPRSNASSVISTTDGKWMISSEGGVMAFFQVPDVPADTGVKDMPGESHFVQVGKSGVKATRMALDPQAATVPKTGSEDLLYIAGGRDGLWVLEADTTGTKTASQRVDDSGNSDIANQMSRRWCCDVDFMYIDGTWYLLALFAKGGNNRLRVYKLADVRATLASGVEIAAWLEVKVTKHPQAPASPPSNSFGTSAAWAMTVDQVNATPGEEAWDVYLALGHHGLARVSFSPLEISPPPPGTPQPPIVQWGPIFGDGSFYNTTTPGNGIPTWSLASYYGNLEYWQRGTNAGDLFYAHHPGTDLMDRTDAPLFADVVVQNDTLGHYLYAAVDHLNWVRFPLDLALAAWDYQTPIDHHEGQPVLNAFGVIEFDIVPSATTGRGRVRELELVDSDPDSGLGPVLVAVASRTPSASDFRTPTEGPAYQPNFLWGGSKTEANVVGNEAKFRTLVYRIDQGFSQGYNFENWTESGNHSLYVPPNQQHSASAEDDLIFLFHQGWTSVTSFIKLDANSNVGARVEYQRKLEHYTGRKVFTIARSILHPDLFLTGANDGGPSEDGILVEGQDVNGDPVIVAKSAGTPDLLAAGSVFNPKSQWVSRYQADEQFFWTHGASPTAGSVQSWCLVKAKIGSDPFNGNPQELLRWYVTVPKDRFDNTGRLTHLMSAMDADYDAYTRAMYGVEMVFATRQYPAAEGVMALRRDVIETHFEEGLPGDNPYPPDAELAVSDFPWPTDWDPLDLNTHPEANWMDSNDQLAIDWWNNGAPGSDTAIWSWRPELVQVDTAGENDLDSWVLVVPCGMINISKDWEIFQGDPQNPLDPRPTWAPEGIWDANFEHSLVQFWDVTNPGSIPLEEDYNSGFAGDNDSPLPKAIGTAPTGMAWRTVSKQVQTANGKRVFCFVADFAGRVLVYDIRDILDQHGSPDTILPEYATWDVTASLFDKLPNGVQGIEVDVVNAGQANEEVYVYLSVRRVGIEILKFLPDQPAGSRFQFVKRLQVSEDPWDLQIAVDSNGVRTLLVAGYRGGIYIYED